MLALQRETDVRLPVQKFLGSRWPTELGQEWAEKCLAFQRKTHTVAQMMLEALALVLRQEGICDIPLEVSFSVCGANDVHLSNMCMGDWSYARAPNVCDEATRHLQQPFGDGQCAYVGHSDALSERLTALSPRQLLASLA